MHHVRRTPCGVLPLLLIISGCGGIGGPAQETPAEPALKSHVAPPPEVIVDDQDSGFAKGGPSSYWIEAAVGYPSGNPHMWWTYNNNATIENSATWTPNLGCAGNYEVLAYIPGQNATTANAKYQISHLNGPTTKPVNQLELSDEWTSLGTYPFGKGTGGSVYLGDATDETDNNWRVGFDAMKWVWKSILPGMQLTVTNPNGGEVWYKGTASGFFVPVNWTSAKVPDNVRIHLYRYGTHGDSFFIKPLVASTANDDYEGIPKSALADVEAGGGYYVCMSNDNPACQGQISDCSDTTFSITDSAIVVGAPNGGETLTSGGTTAVTWNYSGVNGDVIVWLCEDAGCNVTTFLGSASVANKSFTWTIASGLAGSNFRIRVVSNYDNTVVDTSDGTFTIQPAANQTGNITGKVFDNNGEILSGATVAIAPGGATTTTDSSGQYSFGGLAAGEYSVTASRSGYLSQTLSVTVTSGGTATKNFMLTPQQQGDAVAYVSTSPTYGAKFKPNEYFTAYITLKNTGSTTWGGEYYLRRVSGSMALDASNRPVMWGIPPGNTYKFTISMQAPGTLGEKKEVWEFVNPSGVVLQSGLQVVINVVNAPKGKLQISPLSSIEVTMPSGSLDGSRTLTVSNVGDATLTYSVLNIPPWATLLRGGGENVAGLSINLAPGEHDTLTVIFNSHQITKSTWATLSVSSTTGESASLQLNMGIKPPTGLPPPPGGAVLGPNSYGPSKPQQAYSHDPVNTYNGNYTYQHTDLAVATRGPDLIFARTYNSLDTTLGPLGLGWTHSFNVHLLKFDVDGVPGDIYVRWGDGRVDWFKRNDDGTYAAAPGNFDVLTRDGSGLVTVKDTAKTVWNFNKGGQLTSVVDRHSNAMTLIYEDAGLNRLVAAWNTLGEQFIFSYQSADPLKLTEVWDVQGNRKVTFTYEGDLLKNVTDARGNTFTVSYDAGRLTQIIERDGKTLVTNTYNPADQTDRRVFTQQDGLGHTTTLEYDMPTLGETTVTDPPTAAFPAGRKHIYTYDPLGRLVKHTAPSGNDFVEYEYNADNQRTKMTDANKKVTIWDYDDRGNITKITDAVGKPEETQTTWTYYPGTDLVDVHVTPLGLTLKHYYFNDDLVKVEGTGSDIEPFTVEYTWLPTGEPETVKDPMTYVTTLTYKTNGDLQEIKSPPTTASPAGEITSFGYDLSHRVTSVADPYLNSINKAVTYAYDKNDNVTKITDGLVRDTLITPDKRDRVEKVESPNGTVTYQHDDAGRLTNLITPAGTVTYGYNAIYQRTAVTTPGFANTVTTTYAYNPLGYLAGVKDPTNRSIALTADPMGAIKSVANLLNHTATSTPDLLGRAKEVTDPVGRKIELDYNDAGQITSRSGLFDPANPATKVVTTSTYDVLGRMRKVAAPAQGEVAPQYDLNSRLTGLANAKGDTTTWTPDPLGRTETERFNGVTKQTFGYYPGGLLKTAANAKDETATFIYDNAERLKEIQYSDGAKRTIAFETNAKGEETDRVKAITYVEPDGTTTRTRSFAYNPAGRVETLTDPWGKAISYTYWPNGEVKTVTYPGNKTVSYAYDDAGRLTKVTNWLIPPGVTTYAYDTVGRLETITYPNVATATYAYADDGRVKTITHRKADGTILAAQTVGYDGRAQVESIALTPEPTAALEGKELDYTPNAEDQYTKIGALVLDYDPVGRLITPYVGNGPGAQYTFDQRDHLKQAVVANAGAEFTYGPEGERIAQATPTAQTRYVVDTTSPLSTVMTELDGANAPTAYYVYGLGLLARIPADGQNVRYYHQDAQQNITALTDASGNVTDSYFYHPFGQVLAQTGNTPNPYQFAGALGVEQDPTGLYYMRARYYDPAQGRFITKDPIGMAGGINQYAYVENNPAMWADPSGLCFWDACILEATITAYATAVATSPDLYMDINYIAHDWSELQDHRSVGNGVALVADVIGMFIPGVSGLGSGTRVIVPGLKRLPRHVKGRIGETMSLVTNMARGNFPVGFHVKTLTAGAGRAPHWDLVFRRFIFGPKEIVESKFGMGHLSSAQRAAAPYTRNLRVERWTYPFWAAVERTLPVAITHWTRVAAKVAQTRVGAGRSESDMDEPEDFSSQGTAGISGVSNYFDESKPKTGELK